MLTSNRHPLMQLQAFVVSVAARLQDTMVGSAALLQSLAGDAEKAASMLHTLAPEVPLASHAWSLVNTCLAEASLCHTRGALMQVSPARLGIA